MPGISRFTTRGPTKKAAAETPGSATKPAAKDESKTTASASAAPGQAPPMSLRERKQADKKLFEEVGQPNTRKSIKALLERKADPLAVHGRTGITSFHKATKQEANLRALLQERPDLDTASLRQSRNSLFSKGKVGETPMQRATRKGFNDSARVLRDHEAGLRRVKETKDALIESYGVSAAASRHFANLGKTEDFLAAVDALPEVDCDWDAVSDVADKVFQDALDKAPPCTEKSILFLVLDAHGGLAGPVAAAAAMKKMKELGKDLPPEALGFFQEHNFEKAGVEAESKKALPETSTEKAKADHGRGLCFRLPQLAADGLGIPQNDMEENWRDHDQLPDRDHDMSDVLDRNLSGKVKLGVAFCGAGHGGAINDRLHDKFTVIPISFQDSFIRELAASQPVMPDPADESDDGQVSESASAIIVRKMIDVRMRTAHILSNPDINVFRVKDGPTMTYDKFLEMKQRLPTVDA